MLTSQTPTRRLYWQACDNVRDLGGCMLVDGAETRFGAVVRADSLNRLTEQGCAALEAYGVRTIIDLRAALEVEDAPSPLIRHTAIVTRHFPLDPIEQAAGSMVSTYYAMGLPYKAAVNAIYLATHQAQIAAIIRAIATAPEGGVLIHCAVGRDRTGLITALLLAAVGVSVPMIVTDYLLSFSTVAETMEATLGHLEGAYGGILEYLYAAGITEEEVARLRARLRAP